MSGGRVLVPEVRRSHPYISLIPRFPSPAPSIVLDGLFLVLSLYLLAI